MIPGAHAKPGSGALTEAPGGLPARPALFRTEPVDGLVGQLSFDYEIDGQVGVAIPLAERLDPGPRSGALPSEAKARRRPETP